MDAQPDIYSELLNSGIITQAEYDAIIMAVYGIADQLDDLLESGTIGQSAYDAMTEYMADNIELLAQADAAGSSYRG